MQAIELVERGHLVQREQHMRKRRLKLFDCRRQRRGEHRGSRVAKLQRADFSQLGTFHLGLGRFHRRENAACTFKQVLSRLGEKYMPLIPIEQPSTDFLFERPDLNAERRLRDMRAARRRG